MLINTFKNLLTISATSLVFAACSQAGGLNTAFDNEAVEQAPLAFYVAPKFPDQAARYCQEGSVVLEYDIAWNGEVDNSTVRVVDDAGSEAFAESAVDAVKRWKYEPAIENGIAVPRQDVRTAVNFVIDGCSPAN